MATATFTATGNPFDDIRQAAERLSKPTQADLYPVGDVIRQGIASNFANESSGGGQKWEELSPATAKERTRKGFPGKHPILRRNDSLLDTLIDPDNADHISVLATDAIGWTFQDGSEDERVTWLGEGTATIPARPMMDLSETYAEQVGNAVERMFDRLLGF